MAKPTSYPEWAKDLINEIRTINGSQKTLPNRVEPFEEWKATGELSRQPIPREYLNWQLYTIGEWIKYIDSDFMVGTVSESGGEPTGSLIQYDDTANGEVWKFAGGLMLMRRAAAVDVTSTSIQTFPLPASPLWDGGNGLTASWGHLSGAPNPALRNTNIRAIGGGSSSWFIQLETAGTSTDPSATSEKMAFEMLTRWHA